MLLDAGLLLGRQGPVQVIGQQDFEFGASDPAHTAALFCRRAAAREPDRPARGSISISRFLRESAALPRSRDTPVLQDPAESPFPATPATASAARLAASRWLRGRPACRRPRRPTAVVFSITGSRSSSESVPGPVCFAVIVDQQIPRHPPQPNRKRTLPGPEILKRPEHPQKNFLRQILRFVIRSREAVANGIYPPRVNAHQIFPSGFLAGQAPLNDQVIGVQGDLPRVMGAGGGRADPHHHLPNCRHRFHRRCLFSRT